MTRILIPALALLAAAPAASAESKSFNLSGFDEVSVSAGVDVVLKQGPFSVQASEASGKFDDLVVEVRGSRLVVTRKTDWGWSKKRPDYTVTVSAPSITGIGVSSGARVKAENLSLKGVEVSVSSGANASLAGACSSIEASVSSGARLDGEGLRCESADVSASSGANARVYATKEAKGSASSGGNVRVSGNPASFNKSSSSGGSVKAAS